MYDTMENATFLWVQYWSGNLIVFKNVENYFSNLKKKIVFLIIIAAIQIKQTFNWINNWELNNVKQAQSCYASPLEGILQGQPLSYKGQDHFCLNYMGFLLGSQSEIW